MTSKTIVLICLLSIVLPSCAHEPTSSNLRKLASSFQITSVYSYLDPSQATNSAAKPLTLTSVKMTIKEIREVLTGQWHVLAHCEGRPLSENWYISNKIPGSIKTFLIEPEFDQGEIRIYQKHIDFKTGKLNSKLTFVSRVDDLVEIDGGFSTAAGRFHPVRIEESGEIAIESLSVYSACAPGIMAKPLWVPEPTS